MQIVVVFPSYIESQNFIIPRTSHTVNVLVSGVGIYNVLYRLTKYVIQNHVDLIIFSGIAGTFTTNFDITKVVCVQNDVFADIGEWKNNTFHSLFDLGLENPNEFPFTNKRLELPYLAVFDLFPCVSGITVNQITTTEERKNQLIDQFSAQVETMEGAAAHYVCLQEHVPCIHVSAISNNVGERNKNKWNISGSLNSLYKAIHLVIKNV
ncbi:MAG: futalosine hydrolase [Bacteroidales bacterium]